MKFRRSYPLLTALFSPREDSLHFLHTCRQRCGSENDCSGLALSYDPGSGSTCCKYLWEQYLTELNCNQERQSLSQIFCNKIKLQSEILTLLDSSYLAQLWLVCHHFVSEPYVPIPKLVSTIPEPKTASDPRGLEGTLILLTFHTCISPHSRMFIITTFNCPCFRCFGLIPRGSVWDFIPGSGSATKSRGSDETVLLFTEFTMIKHDGEVWILIRIESH